MAPLGVRRTIFVITLVLILLFIPLPVSPTSSLTENPGTRSARTIIVNASGDGDCTHIQWAIDNASDGDTVNVEAGIYFENILVDKMISLLGASRGNTTIFGDGYEEIIKIRSNEVEVKCFKITNKNRYSGGVGIDIYRAVNCNVENNNCFENSIGILLREASEINIINNTCNSNRGNGISLIDSDNNNISYNIAKHNGGSGILIDGISNGSERNKITNNLISANHNGISVSSSDWNTISNNSVSKHVLSGILLGNSDNNEIINNYVCYNNNKELFQSGGVCLRSSENNTISGNYVSFNKKWGIRLEGDVCSIIGNTINTNSEAGIFITYSNSITIMNNTLSYNGDNAIYLRLRVSNITIKNNNIVRGGIYSFTSRKDDWLSLNIDSTNVINGRPLIFLKNSNGILVPPDAGQIIIVNCTNIFIKDQNISNCYVGILVVFSTDSTIINNTLFNNSHAGINIISTNYWGEPEYPCERNLVQNNTCLSNENRILLSGINNIITNNTCNFNKGYGIDTTGNYNKIISNVCNSNGLSGIFLHRSDNNRIAENTCNNNDNQGIILGGSDKNILTNNTCNFNNQFGIQLAGSSLINTITKNICDSNGEHGILLGQGGSLWGCHHNKISLNTCNSNGGYGIYMSEFSESNNLTNNEAKSNGIGDVYNPLLQYEHREIKSNLCLGFSLLFMVLLCILSLIYRISHNKSKGTKDKNSIFMEVKIDMSLKEIEDFLIAKFPKERISNRNNKMFVGGIGSPAFSLLRIYDYKTYRLVSGWGKGWDPVKEIIFAIFLILLIIPYIIFIIWVITKLKTMKKMLLAIKEEDAVNKKL